MNTETGEMLDWEQYKLLKEEKPKEAKLFKEVPENLLSELQNMNRKQRRAFYKLNKKLFKK